MANTYKAMTLSAAIAERAFYIYEYHALISMVIPDLNSTVK